MKNKNNNNIKHNIISFRYEKANRETLKRDRHISFRVFENFDKKVHNSDQENYYYFNYDIKLDVINHGYVHNMTEEVRIGLKKAKNMLLMIKLGILNKKVSALEESNIITYKICKKTFEYTKINKRVGFIDKDNYYYISIKSLYNKVYLDISEKSETINKLYAKIKDKSFNFKEILKENAEKEFTEKLNKLQQNFTGDKKLQLSEQH